MSTFVQSLVYTTRGGMLSTPELRLLAEAAAARGDGRLRVTGRQEVVLSGLAFPAARRLLEHPGAQRLREWSSERTPNIVTTASAVGLPGACEWLTPGLLHDALATFDVPTRVAVSLSDTAQPFVPAITGRINFLASRQRDLWHIHTGDAVLPGAVRTQDLARAASAIVDEDFDLPRAVLALKPFQINLDVLAMPSIENYAALPGALIVPAVGDGISAHYVVDLCLLAAESSGASITLTPWRELCVRGLDPGAFRRAQLQLLRWRVPVSLPWQRVLRNTMHEGVASRLRAVLARQCPVDAGISWALVGPDEMLPEAHVAIQMGPARAWRRARFNVLVRKNNLARQGEWQTVATDLRENEIVRVFLDSLSRDASVPREKPIASAKARAEMRPACQDCLTEYDAAYGDATASVAAGTCFEALPRGWRCPVCGADKNRYSIALQA